MQAPDNGSAGPRARWPFIAYLAAALLVTLQKGVLAGHAGNYFLFRFTFHRFLTGVDIYHPPAGEMTGFLYSPTYALLFAPFTIWPPVLGLLLWNGVNALALYYGLTRVLPPRPARLALAIAFLDMLRSLQNSQSNALVAGLVLISFVALERRREGLAAGAVMVGAVIKIFPLAAGVFGLLAPRRARFLVWSVVIGAGLAVLPLLVLSPAAFVAVYRDWWGILLRDAGLQGQSVMRILSDWFGLSFANWTVQLAGVLALLSPWLVRRSRWTDAAFRLRALSSLLVFLVIFNHQAESASFVIATSGIAIWYVTAPRTWWRTALLALTLLSVAMPRLFFFPYHIYHDVVRPHALDAFPCVLVWIAIQVELWRWSGPGDTHQLDVPPPQPSPQLG